MVFSGLEVDVGGQGGVQPFRGDNFVNHYADLVIMTQRENDPTRRGDWDLGCGLIGGR